MTTTNLSDVPETMLWTLHNRASEAARPDGVLHDPKCTEIYHSLTYDYERSFGKPEPSHGVRSAAFDRAIQDFICRHPDAVIVNLGEGLETQRFRISDDEKVTWFCVDLPEAIAIRERFIHPDPRHQHISASALDTRWFPGCARGMAHLCHRPGTLDVLHRTPGRRATHGNCTPLAPCRDHVRSHPSVDRREDDLAQGLVEVLANLEKLRLPELIFVGFHGNCAAGPGMSFGRHTIDRHEV